MCNHLLVALGRVLGSVNAHDLHLGELVQTVQSAHVLAVRTGFATEALGVGTVLDGQFLLVQDDIAVDVRYGHLCRGNQVEVVQSAMVHLSLLVGQLACTVSAGGIHHGGRHHLLVSALACLVQEEVYQSTLESCTQATVHGEAGTGNLHAQVKVYQVVLLAQFPVGEECLVVIGVGIPVAHLVHTRDALLQVGLHHPVVLGAGTLWHLVVWYVGYLAEFRCQFLLGILHLGLQSLVGGLYFGHLGLHGLGLLLLALLHEAANLSRQFLGIGQVLVQLCLCGTALLVCLHHLCDGLTCTGKTFLLKTGNHTLGLFCNQF